MVLKQWAPAYNEYVRKDRLHKYYERQKTHAKLLRAKKFVQKQEERDAGRLAKRKELEESLYMGAEEEQERYERQLAISFGGPPLPSEPTDEVLQRASRKWRRLAVDPVQAGGNPEDDAQLAEAQEAAAVARKPKKSSPPANDAATKEPPSVRARPARKRRGAEAEAAPSRFSRDQQVFEKRQAEQEAERERRERERDERTWKQKESKKQRAKRGYLLGQRTLRGQPRMQNMLNVLSSKLAGAGGTAVDDGLGQSSPHAPRWAASRRSTRKNSRGGEPVTEQHSTEQEQHATGQHSAEQRVVTGRRLTKTTRAKRRANDGWQ